ncbi:MAG: hypothetical protein HC836_41835 [Richelia sp. RM2_1_2]|nr:hypothetical protein [Richelia sp. RM2_1_2]
MAKKFTLLKRTYPISQIDRPCDGYKYIMENTTEEKRKELGLENLKETIVKGEKYIYQAAKEDKFKYSCISMENFEIIRLNFFGEKDD